MKGLTGIAATKAATIVRARASAQGAPRVLVLTSGLGCGHSRAAAAIERALRRVAPHAVVRQLDFWSLMNPGVAATIQQKYLELVLDRSDLYSRLHRLDERTWRRVIENDIPPPAEVIELIELVTRSGDVAKRSLPSIFEWALGPYRSDLIFYPTACAALPTRHSERAGNNVALLRLALLKWAFLRLQSRMQQQLTEFAPDVVVATQMVPAALVARLKKSTRRWRTLPLVGVLTDFGAHDYWAQPGVDRYCVPHESIAGPPLAQRVGGTVGRIVATGVPLMPGFEKPPAKEAARRALGLCPGDERPVVLVLGGGLGLGLDEIAAPLARGVRDCQLVVMTGRNTVALERMQDLGATLDPQAGTSLRAFGWTDRMETCLAAADLVVGKSGGLTVAEVLACGRPLLVARTLQGQESFNVQFLERHGLGQFVSDEDLPARVQAWLDDPGDLHAAQRAALRAGRRDGAVRVAGEVLELAGRAAGSANPGLRSSAS